MMQRRSTTLLLLIFVGIACLLSGCLGRSPDVRHFMLGSQKMSAAPAAIEAGPSDLAVLIGPIRLPSYLERTQIARRVGGGEVELDEFNRWLGGFEANLTTALAADVRQRLGSVRVVGYPSAAPFPIDYSVRIHVDDCIVDASNALRVSLRWAISNHSEGPPATLAAHQNEVKLSGSSVEALVEAHDRAISVLAEEIAERLMEVSANR